MLLRKQKKKTVLHTLKNIKQTVMKIFLRIPNDWVADPDYTVQQILKHRKIVFREFETLSEDFQNQTTHINRENEKGIVEEQNNINKDASGNRGRKEVKYMNGLNRPNFQMYTVNLLLLNLWV